MENIFSFRNLIMGVSVLFSAMMFSNCNKGNDPAPTPTQPATPDHVEGWQYHINHLNVVLDGLGFSEDFLSFSAVVHDSTGQYYTLGAGALLDETPYAVTVNFVTDTTGTPITKGSNRFIEDPLYHTSAGFWNNKTEGVSIDLIVKEGKEFGYGSLGDLPIFDKTKMKKIHITLDKKSTLSFHNDIFNGWADKFMGEDGYDLAISDSKDFIGQLMHVQAVGTNCESLVKLRSVGPNNVGVPGGPNP